MYVLRKTVQNSRFSIKMRNTQDALKQIKFRFNEFLGSKFRSNLFLNKEANNKFNVLI